MQKKLRRLSQQSEIFQRLRMIIFKGNLKVNLPLTFKGSHYNQGNNRQIRSLQNNNRNHRQMLPQINFRPHPPRSETNQPTHLPFSFVPTFQHQQNHFRQNSNFRPNLNNFIISHPQSNCKNIFK